MTAVSDGVLGWSVPPVDAASPPLIHGDGGADGPGGPGRSWVPRLVIAIVATLVILTLVGVAFVAVAAASSGPVASCGGG